MGGQMRRASLRVAWRRGRDWAWALVMMEEAGRGVVVRKEVASERREVYSRGEVMMWARAERTAQAVVSEPEILGPLESTLFTW